MMEFFQNLLQKFDVPGLLEALPILGKGMLGIFIVTIAIILTVPVLNATTNKKK